MYFNFIDRVTVIVNSRDWKRIIECLSVTFIDCENQRLWWNFNLLIVIIKLFYYPFAFFGCFLRILLMIYSIYRVYNISVNLLIQNLAKNIGDPTVFSLRSWFRIIENFCLKEISVDVIFLDLGFSNTGERGGLLTLKYLLFNWFSYVKHNHIL